MKMFTGKITGSELDKFFNDSINYHKNILINTIEEYEAVNLYRDWRTIIRSIEELINIPLELDGEEEIQLILNLSLDLINEANLASLRKIIEILKRQFENNVDQRFVQLVTMAAAINKAYKMNGIFDLQDNQLNLADVENSIAFFQSRRAYYNTVLTLIPQIAKGEKQVSYIDTLNHFQYTLDSCMVGITTSYYNLLCNVCLPDFEMEANGKIAKGNFDFTC